MAEKTLPSPLVSIIIPTYNMRQWIGEAIDSALAQTYPHIEIIVVDDGSTDGTGDFLRERYGDRIRYVYQENRGRGAARNRGLELARGEYIQFLDADDLLAPHKLEKHVRFLEEYPQFSAVYGQTMMFADGNPELTWPLRTAQYFASGNLLNLMIAVGGLFQLLPVLVRHDWVEFVGGFDERMPRCEDFDFWLRMAHAGALFAYLPSEPVGFYRKYEVYTSRNGQRAIYGSAGPGNEVDHACNVLYALNKLARTLSPREYRDLGMARAMANAQFNYGRALLLHRRRREGVAALLRSLRHASGVGTRFQAIVYLSLATWLPYRWVEDHLDTFLRWQHRLRKAHKMQVKVVKIRRTRER